MDFFKIVSTKEKKGIYFTVVPHKWEVKKELYWPQHLKHSEREALRAQAASAPGSDWAKYDCILKCSNIQTFEEGLKIEKQLTECTDTEAEEVLFTTTFKKPTKEIIDRNELFQNLYNPETISNYNDLPMVFVAQDQDQDQDEEIGETFEGSEVLITEQLKKINEEISNIKLEIGNLRQENKQNNNKIMLYLDKICMNAVSLQDVQMKSSNSTIKEDLLNKFNFPLRSCNEITMLDKEIRMNPEFKKQLITALSRIGGTSGEEDGGKVGYKIVDYIFKSDVLINYTWTGIARGKQSEPKKPFQGLEGILQIIFEVLLLADSRHTVQKNANLFKEGVLKHAKKRNLRKRVCNIEKNNDSNLTTDVRTEDEHEDGGEDGKEENETQIKN